MIINNTIHKRVNTVLLDCGVQSPTVHQKVNEACNPGNMFEGLTSRHLREKYYKDYHVHESSLTKLIIIDFSSNRNLYL